MIRLSLAGCQVTTAVILIQETYVSNERSNSVLLECLFTEAEAEAGRNSVFNFLHSKPSGESRVWAARCYGCYDWFGMVTAWYLFLPGTEKSDFQSCSSGGTSGIA